MNIKDICISDSSINEYKLENNTLTMIIKDYTDTLYEIVIDGCGFLLVKGTVGFDLSEGKFTKSKGIHYWCFYDEDGAVMELKFKGYKMNELKEK